VERSTWDGTWDGVVHHRTDLLVVGSGFAGLWAAIAARDRGIEEVTILDKGDVARSSQSRMSAGATVYLLEEDDLDTWVRDVAEAQQWLCHQDMVEDMLASSTSRLQALEGWGVRYEHLPDGSRLRLPSRGFQDLKMMVLPTYRGRTGGRAVTTALREQVVRRRCELLPRLFATDLLTGDEGVEGVVAIERGSGAPHVVHAKAVVLAAGDCSFRGHYAGVDSTTGDGVALALRAGARVANMEFLCVNTGPVGFGFEGTGIALRFGGVFRNAEGDAFMASYHPDADAAELGHLVRAMAIEEEHGRGPVRLDLSAAAHEHSFLRVAFDRMGGFMPMNLARMAAEGVDVFGEPLEWEPAIQTLRGGVRTEVDGATDLPGLFAAGMTQAFDPGLFNGWSSSRAMWSGEKAGTAAAALLAGRSHERSSGAHSSQRREAVLRLVRSAREPLSADRRHAPTPDEVLGALQEALFSREVCLRKTHEALAGALAEVQVLGEVAEQMRAADPHDLVKAHETSHMVLAAELFLRGSLMRRESRGDHQRADHENTDPSWLCWIDQHLAEPRAEERTGTEVVVELEPVPLQRYRFGPAAGQGAATHDPAVTR
jgi:succinate dehydrogenase/fumarate reductase flavoprotein subunit